MAIYLRIDGITGESQAANFAGQIELSSFTFGGSNGTNLGSAGSGAGVGKMSFSPMVATRSPDSASPALFLAMAQGKSAATATISFVPSGGSAASMKIDLSPVIVTSMSTNATGSGVVETITLASASLKYTMTGQAPTGGLKPPVIGGWDISKNKLV